MHLWKVVPCINPMGLIKWDSKCDLFQYFTRKANSVLAKMEAQLEMLHFLTQPQEG